MQKKVQDSRLQEEAKPQLKEHCSSMAGQALKNAALGVMLAASVIAGAKAATVPVKAAEPQQPLDNSTSISQQAETDVAPKTEIEAAVDEMIENKVGQPTELHVGGKLDCIGRMTDSFSFIDERNYDSAEFTKVRRFGLNPTEKLKGNLLPVAIHKNTSLRGKRSFPWQSRKILTKLMGTK